MKFTYTTGDQPVKGYTIQRGIGRGGFGEVYQGISDGGKEVALKLVQRNLNVELRGVAHCLNVKHTNLVSLYDVKQDENGDTWVVMEYVAGGTLDQVLAHNQQGLSPEEALFWLRGLCAGVGYLHERGIVHRDLKPGNIFIENGIVKLGDYGLSKFISASRRSGQTESVGTVHYMAPEVSMGCYNRELDLYAIGIIFYEMLTGRVPFDGESPGEILMKHLTAVPDLTPVPEPYRSVIGKLLDKDPLQRYPSLEAMLADLPPAASWAGVLTGYKEIVITASAVPPGIETQAYESRLFGSQFRYMASRVGKALVGVVRTVGEEAHHALRSNLPTAETAKVGLTRLLVAVMLGTGAGLITGGLGLIIFRDEEAAALLGVGAGFFSAGMIASRLLRLVLHLLWWRGLVPLLFGVGGGFLAGGLAAAIAPRGGDAPPFISIGVGFLLSARMAYRFSPPAAAGAGWRLVLAVAQGFGIIMLAVGLTLLFFRRHHEAPILMGIGSGLVVAGIMTYRLVLRVETKKSPSTSQGRDSVVEAVPVGAFEEVRR